MRDEARDEDDDAPAGVGARRTIRQQLRGLLLRDTLSFATLRQVLGLSVRQLEDELRHVDRSVRAHGGRLVMIPPLCLACEFCFRDRESRHLHAPGRCPRCRSERITDPAFRIDSGEREG